MTALEFVDFVNFHFPDRDIYALDKETPTVITKYLQAFVMRNSNLSLDDLKNAVNQQVTDIGAHYGQHHGTDGVYTRSSDGVWSGLPTISFTVHAYVAQLYRALPSSTQGKQPREVPGESQKVSSRVEPKAPQSDVVEGFFVPDVTRRDVGHWLKYCRFLVLRRPGVGPLEMDDQTPQFIADFLIWACSDKKSRDENGVLYGCLGMSPTSGRALATAIQHQVLCYYETSEEYHQNNDGTFVGNPVITEEVDEALLYLKYGKAYVSPRSRNKVNHNMELTNQTDAELAILNDKELNGSYWNVEQKLAGFEKKRRSKELKLDADVMQRNLEDEKYLMYQTFVQDNYPGRDALILDAQTPSVLVNFFKFHSQNDGRSQTYHQLCAIRTSIRKMFEFKYKNSDLFKARKDGTAHGLPTLSQEVREYFDYLKQHRKSGVLEPVFEPIAHDASMEVVQEIKGPQLDYQDSMTVLKTLASKDMPLYDHYPMKKSVVTSHPIFERMGRAYSRICSLPLYRQVDIAYYAACLISFLGLISLEEIVNIKKASVVLTDDNVKIVLKSGRILEFDAYPEQSFMCPVTVLSKFISITKRGSFLVSDATGDKKTVIDVLRAMQVDFIGIELDSQTFQTAGVLYYRYLERWTLNQIVKWSCQELSLQQVKAIVNPK